MKKLTALFIFFFSTIIFSQQTSGRPGSEIFFFNENVGAIIKNNNTILVTSNGAAEWNAVSLPENKKAKKILYVSETDAWALSSGSVFQSLNGGNDWSEIETFPFYVFSSIYFLNENTGFIGGQGTESNNYKSAVFYTKNKIDWEEAAFDFDSYSSIISISFGSETTGIAVTPSNVFKTTDGGANWKKLDLEFFIGQGALISGTMFDENNILLAAWKPVVVAEGYLLSSSDGGNTWNESDKTFKWGINDCYFFDQNTLWIATPDSVFYSGNAGATWNAYDVRLNKFSFFNKSEAYGLDESNLLYTDDGWANFVIVDSTITAIFDEISRPDGFKMYQNYPNPFGAKTNSGNPTTTIAFELHQAAQVKMIVYNSIGQIVKSIKEARFPAGRHEIIFDAGSLPSGIYFYQIQTERFQNAKKFVILR